LGISIENFEKLGNSKFSKKSKKQGYFKLLFCSL